MFSLCCISKEIKSSFKTMTWKKYKELASEDLFDAKYKLGAVWLNNVCVTHDAIKHCIKNGWNYRVSSSLFPILTHPDSNLTPECAPQYGDIAKEFRKIRDCGYNIRLSTHPDQFNVLASESDESVEKTIKELNHHGWIMDMLGCPRSYEAPMNIHVNCSKGPLDKIANKFFNNLVRCDDSVVSRLVIENEDKGVWNVSNCLKYFGDTIPVTFDNLHNKCNPSELSESECLDACSKTWRGYTPLFHYSESDPSNKNPRAHADIPVDIPPVGCYDWDVELKSKDKAVRILQETTKGAIV